MDPIPDTSDLDRKPLNELWKIYEAEVGQPTRCPNKLFLKRAIGAARGEAAFGERFKQGVAKKRAKAKRAEAERKPARAGSKPAAKTIVLPVRFDADVVARLDEAWRRRGLRSRMDLFRRALRSFLASVGERETAALFDAGE